MLFFLKAKPTFDELTKTFLRLRKFKSKRTEQNTIWQIARLGRYFGPVSIAEINDERWIDYVSQETARKNRKFFDERKCMRMVLRFAVKKKIIQEMPELPIPDLPSKPGREISSAELAALEANADPNLRLQIRIAWKMGLRLGEMLRLRWADFDWEKETIQIYASKTRTFRLNPLPFDLKAEFKEKMRCSASLNVFPNPTGTGPATSNHTAWATCRERARVKARWQDLRHTCATILARNGNTARIGALYLGHSEKVHTTRYVHLHMEDLRIAANRMSSVSLRFLSLRLKDWLADRAVTPSFPPGTLKERPSALGKNGA